MTEMVVYLFCELKWDNTST